MSDHEQAAQQAEDEADRLAQESDRLEDGIEEAKATRDAAYKDPVIAEPLDEDGNDDDQ